MSEYEPIVLWSNGSITDLESSVYAELQSDEPKSDALLASLDKIAKTAPTNELPYFYRALIESDRDDTVLFKAFLDAAMRRNPRNVASHLLELQFADRQKDYSGLVQAIDTLLLLEPENREAYYGVMIATAKDPASHDALVNWASEETEIAIYFASILNRSSEDIDLLWRVNQNKPTLHPQFLSRVLEISSIKTAYHYWLKMLTEDERRLRTFPYNPNFLRKTAPAPFNWRVDERSASIEPNGGVYVTYDGRGRRVILEQILLLPPNQDYTLKVDWDSNSRVAGPFLRWDLVCISSRSVLSTIKSVETTEHKMRRMERVQDFRIPDAGCDIQRIRLTGEPGDRFSDVRTIIYAVEIYSAETQGVIE